MDEKTGRPVTEQETGRQPLLGIASLADDTVVVVAAAAAVAAAAVAAAVTITAAGNDVPEFQPPYTWSEYDEG